MKEIGFRKTIGLVCLVVLFPAMALAFGGQGRGGGQKGPPEAAIEACSGKNVGDVVEFDGRRSDTISGTCQEKDGMMFAVPEGHRRGGGRR